MIRAEETDEGCYILHEEWATDEMHYEWNEQTHADIFLRGESIGSLYVWNDSAMEAEVGHPCPYIVIDNEMIHLSELKEVKRMKFGRESKVYSNMNIKEKIAYDCGGTQLIDDVNHAVRRFFRCWLDGSYNGEGHYITNCEFVKRNHDNHKEMRAFVVNEFVHYIARDYGCSYGHAQSCLVLAINRADLERLNDLLVEDAKDLVDIPKEEEE